ncbi:hypothetical protein MHU86_7161 [Fragilaria crotonensis]|nr:hypothetical protein MHU86_7161 [Fragilaria crotonensis]
MRNYAQLPARARPAEVESGSDGKWKLQGQPSASIRIPSPPPSATATFDLFINTLDPWETELLRQTILNVDPFSLCLELTTGIRAVSDGSVIATHHGSFGWVLSSLNGERLAFGNGPVRGRIPHSFRAEAYGLLSLLRFLIRVKEFTGMHEPWVGVLATDSQSVLDTLQIGDVDPQEEDTPVDLDKGAVVLDCLRPDWDILIEIQHALQSLPQVSLRYVEGHQDKKRPYQSLDLFGQLNVTPTQAGIYNAEHGAHRPIVLLSPLAKAHLILPDGTVTGKYSTVLLHETSAKPLLEYIRCKNEWSPSTLQYINWDAHTTALNRTHVSHTHMVKLLHRLIPTFAQANKFDGGTRRCVLCGSLGEDQFHILRCEHGNRLAWRNRFTTRLRDFFIQSNTSPMLSELMLDGIRKWFSSSEKEIALNPDDYHASVRQIILHQNRIGWSQLFMGRFSVTWAQQQRQYQLRQRGETDKEPHTSAWQVNLILVVWEQWHTLWKQRNGEVHGHDERTKAEASRRDVRRQLTEIYRNRSLYEACPKIVTYQCHRARAAFSGSHKELVVY